MDVHGVPACPCLRISFFVSQDLVVCLALGSLGPLTINTSNSSNMTNWANRKVLCDDLKSKQLHSYHWRLSATLLRPLDIVCIWTGLWVANNHGSELMLGCGVVLLLSPKQQANKHHRRIWHTRTFMHKGLYLQILGNGEAILPKTQTQPEASWCPPRAA